MRAYLGIKYHPDNRNRDVLEGVSAVLADCGFASVCVTRDLEGWGDVRLAPRDLMRETFKIIDSCDLVVIELSEKGVGLGIEAGYAYAKGLPVVTVAKRGSDISETLRGISRNIFFYEDFEDLLPLFTSATLDF